MKLLWFPGSRSLVLCHPGAVEAGVGRPLGVDPLGVVTTGVVHWGPPPVAVAGHLGVGEVNPVVEVGVVVHTHPARGRPLLPPLPHCGWPGYPHSVSAFL